MDNLEVIENAGEQESRAQRCKKAALTKENILVFFIVLGVAGGVGLGLGLNGVITDKREIMYVGFIGDMFLRTLKAIILPLIVASLVTGLAALDAKLSGKMGWVTIVYYMSTTLIAVFLGIGLVTLIKPGEVDEDVDRYGEEVPATVTDTFLDLIRNMLPDNLVTACFQRDTTRLIEPEMNDTNLTIEETTGDTPVTADPYDDLYSWDFEIVKVDGLNILGIVVYCVLFGILLGRLGEAGRPLVAALESLNLAVMKLVHIVMWFAPIGIMSLIAGLLLETEDFSELLSMVGLYMVTVLVGLGIHALVILPLIYFIITRKNPFIYLLGVLQALLTAAGTASSSATLPVTLTNLEENNGIDPRVAKFVLPVGATINMDGTALYEAVAVIFIAQYNNLTLDFGQIVALSITATAASIGAAGIPQAGLVTMSMVLTAVGLPINDVTLILSVDWLLDRFRTAVNVWGDSIGAGVVHHVVKDDLDLTTDPTSTEKTEPPPYNGGGTVNRSFQGDQSQVDSDIHRDHKFIREEKF